MTSPAPEWGSCRIRGEWVDLLGQPVSGTVTLTASPKVLLAAQSQRIVVPTARKVTLDEQGRIDVTVPATDDPDINPTGWTYTVAESFTGGGGRTYAIQAPDGGDIQLATVAPVPTANGQTIVVGPAGPAGTDGADGAPGEPGRLLGELVTVDSWMASRGSPFYVAHRGSGDIVPECSMEAFEWAIQNGARCMEVSVHSMSGVLVVNHDANGDRTWNVNGAIASMPASALRSIQISKMTQTGAAWSGSNGPKVALFEDVLRKYGGRVVMCVEAKADAAYPAMTAMIERYGLQDSTIIKAFHSSPRIAEAKAAGFRVFGYFGNKGEISQANVDNLASRGVDFIVIPYFDGDVLTPMPDVEVQRCVATDREVWMYPLHRRFDVPYNVARGVTGFIVSGYGYVNTTGPRASTDSWWTQAIAPGELTLDQSGASYAPGWTSPNILTLGRTGRHFLSLGSVPNPAGTYTVDFDARWDTLPADTSQNLTLAFGRNTDQYYEHQYGKGNGYHAIMRANGQFQLYAHTDGSTAGSQLGSTVTTAAAVAGAWMHFRVQVTPTDITWTRTDVGAPNSITVTNSVNRGGYLHLGKSSTDGVLALRNLVIS